MDEAKGDVTMGTRTSRRAGRLFACLAVLALPGAGLAQIEDVEGRLLVELNAAQSLDGGCSLSFLVINGLPEAIDSLVLEAVLFDAGGQVDRLTLFDFGSLPATRPRVRQFVLPGMACESVGAVLINGTETCAAAGGAPLGCADALELRSRVEIDLLG
jgi:hypothetical protein